MSTRQRTETSLVRLEMKDYGQRADRILHDLTHQFGLTVNGPHANLHVEAPPSEALRRVLAALDDSDPSWRRHFQPPALIGR